MTNPYAQQNPYGSNTYGLGPGQGIPIQQTDAQGNVIEMQMMQLCPKCMAQIVPNAQFC